MDTEYQGLDAFKGILVLFAFIIFAELFGLTTISWLVERSLNVLIML